MNWNLKKNNFAFLKGSEDETNLQKLSKKHKKFPIEAAIVITATITSS